MFGCVWIQMLHGFEWYLVVCDFQGNADADKSCGKKPSDMKKVPHGPILSHRYSQSQGKKRCSKFNACPVACFTLLGLRFCHSIVALLAHQDESTGHAVGRGPQDVASMCQKATLILNSTVYSYFMLFFGFGAMVGNRYSFVFFCQYTIGIHVVPLCLALLCLHGLQWGRSKFIVANLWNHLVTSLVRGHQCRP